MSKAKAQCGHSTHGEYHVKSRGLDLIHVGGRIIRSGRLRYRGSASGRDHRCWMPITRYKAGQRQETAHNYGNTLHGFRCHVQHSFGEGHDRRGGGRSGTGRGLNA